MELGADDLRHQSFQPQGSSLGAGVRPRPWRRGAAKDPQGSSVRRKTVSHEVTSRSGDATHRPLPAWKPCQAGQSRGPTYPLKEFKLLKFFGLPHVADFTPATNCSTKGVGLSDYSVGNPHGRTTTFSACARNSSRLRGIRAFLTIHGAGLTSSYPGPSSGLHFTMTANGGGAMTASRLKNAGSSHRPR